MKKIPQSYLSLNINNRINYKSLHPSVFVADLLCMYPYQYMVEYKSIGATDKEIKAIFDYNDYIFDFLAVEIAEKQNNNDVNNGLKKTIIKRLAKEIVQVLDSNEYANEMNGAYDYGEWSSTSPDFSKLVKRWSLTREQLSGYIDTADKFAREFDEHYKIPTKKNGRMMMPEEVNYWYGVETTLHCIFMAGNL